MVAGFLLIGVISASLTPFLSNFVRGKVEFNGPVFYLDNEEIMEEGYYTLKLNKSDVSESYFKLDEERFYSDSLGVESFYPMDFNIKLRAKVLDLPVNETTNETYGSCSVKAEITKTDNKGNYLDTLCYITRVGFNEESYKDYTINCEGEYDSEINLEEGDRLELMLVEYCPDGSKMNIKLNGESYMEVVPKQ